MSSGIVLCKVATDFENNCERTEVWAASSESSYEVGAHEVQQK